MNEQITQVNGLGSSLSIRETPEKADGCEKATFPLGKGVESIQCDSIPLGEGVVFGAGHLGDDFAEGAGREPAEALPGA